MTALGALGKVTKQDTSQAKGAEATNQSIPSPLQRININ